MNCEPGLIQCLMTVWCIGCAVSGILYLIVKCYKFVNEVNEELNDCMHKDGSTILKVYERLSNLENQVDSLIDITFKEKKCQQKKNT